MAQFYYEGSLFKEQFFFFDEKESAHLKVFRVKKGDKVKVFSSKGERFLVEVLDFKDKKVYAKVLFKLTPEKSGVKIKLYFSFLEKSAFEEVLKKCTELGADELIPCVFERTQKNHILSDMKKCEKRFFEIILSALKQSERENLPKLLNAVSFKDIFSLEKNIFLFNKTDSSKKPSPSFLNMGDLFSEEISLVIGPEGGFSQGELELAASKAVFASLGPNVLRAQTAAALACGIAGILK